MFAEWQRMAFARKLAEWQADKLLFYAIQHSTGVRMPLRAQARMPLNAIKNSQLKKFSVFRFPFSVFC